MYRKPDHIALLGLVFFISLGMQEAYATERNPRRDFALGSIHSPKGVGACSSFKHESGAFGTLDLTADLIDILDGTSSTPGIKAAYHYNLVLKSWAEGKYELYAGPGLTAGWVRDTHNHVGLMGGLSGDAGLRVHCLHSMLISVEWQVDFALQFKNRYNPDMSLYAAGFRLPYIPYVRIQYCF